MSEFERNVIGKFDCYGDQANVGTRWTRWLQSFQLFVDSQEILIAEGSDKNKQRQRAQLLHYAGPNVQDIFSTLENIGEANDYAIKFATKSFRNASPIIYAGNTWKKGLV